MNCINRLDVSAIVLLKKLLNFIQSNISSITFFSFSVFLLFLFNILSVRSESNK
jgi:hypothetical protein